MPVLVDASGLTDIGLVRQNNEDVWAELPAHRFFTLADGMGGHRAGEVASQEAISFLCETVAKSQLKSKTLGEMREWLRKAIQQVNQYVYKLGRECLELRGMGTTLCCVWVHDQGVIYAHVGDSRIYRVRKGKISQLTNDHSLMREMVSYGLDEEGDYLYKNIITRAVGTELSVEPSVDMADVQPGDAYLLCTDGLSDLLVPSEMEAIINQEGESQKAVYKLVNKAIQKGGHDNITVILLRLKTE